MDGVDVMLMSKWVTKNFRFLSSCMTSRSMHELLFITITNFKLWHWNIVYRKVSRGVETVGNLVNHP